MGCLRRLFRLLFSLLIVILLLAGGAYALIYYYTTQKLPDELRRYFFLPPSAKVEINHGTPLDSFSGRLESVRINSSEAKVGELVVTDLRLSAEDIEFSIPNLLLKRSPVIRELGEASVRFLVPKSSLEEYWLNRGSTYGLKEVRIVFRLGTESEPVPSIDIFAKFQILEAKIDFKLNGYYELSRNGNLVFKIFSTEVEGLKVGRDILEKVFVSLAPKISVSALQRDLIINEFKILGEGILISATTDRNSD